MHFSWAIDLSNFKQHGYSMGVSFDLVKEEWNGDGSLNEALKSFSLKLQAWNKSSFGNIFQHKKCNKLKLTGIHKALSRGINNQLLRLERELKEERKISCFRKSSLAP